MIRASLILKPREARAEAARVRATGDAAREHRYAALKTQAQYVASKATSKRTEPYLVLASSWITLVEELERLTQLLQQIAQDLQVHRLHQFTGDLETARFREPACGAQLAAVQSTDDDDLPLETHDFEQRNNVGARHPRHFQIEGDHLGAPGEQRLHQAHSLHQGARFEALLSRHAHDQFRHMRLIVDGQKALRPQT
jgi:hypothetical protein